jgi:hypothetical protein
LLKLLFERKPESVSKSTPAAGLVDWTYRHSRN